MGRLLFFTYYFPPSGGPGVQRALKFAKYLPAFGWEPVVVTVRPERAAYPNLDPTLEEEVPPDLRVERTVAWDPYALYAQLQGKKKQEAVGVSFTGEAEASALQRFARWVRANVFLPDARVGWVPFAAWRGRQLLQEGGYDAIFSTGPPHSAHLPAMLLSGRNALPWVADFRDPWTGSDYYSDLPMTAPARALDAAMERAALRRASAAVAVTPTWRRELSERAPGRYEVIQNGFDPEDFQGAAPGLGEEFTIMYAGNLNDARNPAPLWRALEALGAPEAWPQLRVRLIGNVDPVVLRRAKAAGIGSLVQTQDYVPHAEAVHAMRSAALNLLVINRVPGAEGIIPGKLYEYIAAGRPVLGIGPPASDAAEVLAESGAGQMFDYEDASGVARFLQEHYRAWMEGTPRSGASPEAAARYSRKEQTGQLAALLDELSR